MSVATGQPGVLTSQVRQFALAAAILSLCFAGPLWRLFWFSLSDDLHSYIPLMPFVSVYLAWVLKGELRAQFTPARGLAVLFLLAGAAAGIFGLRMGPSGTSPAEVNHLALATLGWVLCLIGAGLWFFGGAMMKALAFPFFLLVFTVPFPAALRDAIEVGLEHGSAEVAYWMFSLSGMPVFRDGLTMRLPGITLNVAPECSGIHSTWVLFITSLVAGRMLLRRPMNRAILCLAVIPLALLRNGFRVWVLGELCAHVSPRMIDSPIHHHGGPLFFVLSLVPFFLLLYFIRRRERTVSVGQLSKSDN